MPTQQTSYPLVPLFYEIIGRFVILGVLQIFWAVVLSVLHIVWGLIVIIYAVLRYMIRSIYDCITFQFIKCCGRIPRRDTSYARIISGPGVSGKYFYKINLEDIFILLYAQLEKLELAEFEQRILRHLNKPLEEARNTIN
jgi:hypothetical protein